MALTSTVTLVPAYGRDYKSGKEALADFDANKDFMLMSMYGSGLINREQIMPEEACRWVQLRFKKQTGLKVVDMVKERKKVLKG